MAKSIEEKRINKIINSKRFKRTWHAYNKRYNRAKRSMSRRGMTMISDKLSKKDLLGTIEAFKEEGIKNNIVQKVVVDQQYAYSADTARRFKKVSEEMDLEWKDVKYTRLRYGDIDVSGINQWLKDNTDKTGYERAKYIGHEVFGS